MKIEIKDFSYSYTRGNLVLSNISVVINSGDFVAILGHNGSGKTTLMKAILNELKIPDNKIKLDDIDINIFNNWSNIGYVPQKFNNFSYNYPINIDELLRSSLNDTKKINEVLKLVNIVNFRYVNFNELSGGQQQRVFIARALLHDPDLIVLDEPFVGIDEESCQNIYELLVKLNESGKTILLVTHQEHSTKKYVKSIITLNNKVFYYGPANKYDDRMCELC